MNKKKIRVRFFILLLSFLFMSIGYSVLKQTLTIGASAGLIVDVVDDPPTGGDPNIEYNVEYSISKWPSGGYNYQFNPFTLSNLSSENVTSWNMVFDIPDDSEIKDCWNMICVFEDGYLTMHSTRDNSSIPGGSNVTNFGFQILTQMDNYELNIVSTNLYTDAYPNPLEVEVQDNITLTHTPGSGWNEGGMYVRQFNFTINNENSFNLTSWEIVLNKPSTDSTMSNNWGCNFIDKGDKFIITGEVNNKGVEAGKSHTFGLQIKLPSLDFEFSNDDFTVIGHAIIIES